MPLGSSSVPPRPSPFPSFAVSIQKPLISSHLHQLLSSLASLIPHRHPPHPAAFTSSPSSPPFWSPSLTCFRWQGRGWYWTSWFQGWRQNDPYNTQGNIRARFPRSLVSHAVDVSGIKTETCHYYQRVLKVNFPLLDPSTIYYLNLMFICGSRLKRMSDKDSNRGGIRIARPKLRWWNSVEILKGQRWTAREWERLAEDWDGWKRLENTLRDVAPPCKGLEECDPHATGTKGKEKECGIHPARDQGKRRSMSCLFMYKL